MNKNTAAFTIVELTIVIILLGILSAVALPKFFDLSSDSYRAINNSTAAALNTASTAITAKAKDPSTAFVSTSVNATYNSTLPTKAFLLDENTTIKMAVWFPPNASFPIGAASNTSSSVANNSTYSAITMQNTSIQASCSDLFNGLLSSSSAGTVFPSYGATAGYTPTNPNYNTFAASIQPTGKTNNLVVPPGVVSINGSITTPTRANLVTLAATSISAPGGCLYQLTASANSNSTFYIYYSTGVFTAFELN
jgi:type II secretory pathway pseudopilin PulG